jgi:TP901 family phage tail tape measure protein
MASGALTMGNVNTARSDFRRAISNVSDLAVQSVQARTATSLLTESIIKRDLSMKQSMQVHKQFTNILKEQYALQRAMAVQWTSSTSGRMNADVVIPRGASASVDAMTNSLRANTVAMARGLVGMGGLNAAWSVMRVRIGLTAAALNAASASLIKWGKNTQWAGRQLMVGFTVPLMAFGALAGKAAYDVDKSMTRIQKVYDTTATSVIGKQRELDMLRTQSMAMATQVAKMYGQSMKDTLDLEADLAATGLKGAELQASTVAVTRAATLGEIDRQNAMKATIALQSVYGHSAEELAKDFNYMNQIENSTSLSMQDFIDAIPRGAGVMKNLGVDLREMGIVLVALKQNGVSAAEGMNGMRSAAQRLLMITPKAEETWKGLLPDAGTLSNLVKANKGEFIPTLQAMGEAMKELEPYQRQQIIARVFGVYQANKIYGVLDGLVNKTGQVATAYNVMNQDIADGGAKAASVAQSELDKMAQSASGKFKRAVESIKAQLATVGEPFLEVGSAILGFIGKLFDMFNSMPGMLKKVLAGLIIGGAILGPIIMLVGLFANLIGHIVKLGGLITGLFTRFRPLTIEQRAQAMLAERSTLAWANQGRAAQALAGQLSILTTQMERMAIAQMQANGTAITRFGGAVPGVVTNTGRRDANGNIIHTPLPGGAPVYGPSAPTGQSPYRQTANGRYQNIATGRFVSAAEMNAYQQASAAAARSSQQTAAATGVTQRNWGRIAVSMGAVGVMSAGMMAASGSSSQIMNYLSMALLSASLLGPMLVTAFRNAGIAAAASNVAMMFGTGRRAGSIAGRGGAGQLLSGLSAALPAAGRLGMVIARFAGPAGLLATGAYMAFKLYGNMKKGIQTQERINASAKDWASVLGFVYTEAGEVKKANDEIVSSIDAQVTKLKEKNKELVKSLQIARDNKDTEEAINLAIAEGIKVRNHGGSAQNAEDATRLSLRAAGYKTQEIQDLMIKVRARIDFSDAESTMNEQMDQFKTMFNKVANNKFGQGGWEGFGRMFSGRNDLNQNAAKRGEGMASEFWTGFQKENDLQSRRKYFDKFFKAVQAEQKTAWGRLGNDNRKDLKKVGIESWEEFQEAFRDSQELSPAEFQIKYADGDGKKATELMGVLQTLGSETTRYADKHIQAEQLVAREIAKKNNVSDEEIKKIHTLKDLYGVLDMATMTVAEAQEAFSRAMMQASYHTVDMSKKEAAAYNLKILNQYRVAAGLSKATSLEQGFGDAVHDSTGKAKANADAMAEAAASTDDWANARQKAMSGAQDYALQAAEDIWSERADAETKAIEERGERRENALDAQAERADKRFDDRQEAADKRFDKRSKNLDKKWDKIEDNFEKRWDKRIAKEEAAYNKRIDNIKKAIDAEEKAEETRQKIFEAEKTRLERMASIANMNIDFNVAMNSGNLDEAAKIANNIQSTTDSWTLDDAAASSQTQSDARKDAMEKKITSIEAERDKRIESLKRVEEAEKKALEAKKEREQEALAAERERYNKALEAERERYRKGIEAQKKAIQEQTQRDVEAKRKEIERMKKTLELELLAVRASIPRNKKEYDKQIKTIEKLYAKYGVNLKAQGNKWSETIGNGLTAHIKEASVDLQNQIKWKNIGNNVTQKMVDGGFNMSTAEFMKWVTSGELPKKYSAPSKPKTRHKGGPVSGNSKYDNRGGRHWGAGMRRDESMMLLKNDEYVLNGKAHKMLGTSTLDRINKGDVGTGGIGGAEGLGLTGMYAAAAEGMFEAAADMAIQAAGNNAMGFGIDGMAIAGKAGMYGNVRLSNEQLSNAATIIGVGKSLGASVRDNIIAIMTAMQESTLRNLNYGDRDSVGLFQQRNAWGSFADRTNPSKSARMFFLGGAAGQRGLFDFPNRGKMSLAQAAQAVQVSAFPSAYAKWEDMARAVVSGTSFQPFGGVGGTGAKQRPVSGPISRSYANHSNLPRATDFGVATGTPVRAAMNGVVTTSADLRSGNGYRSYGRYIVIQNANEKTLYAHLSERGVGNGRQVRAGQLIGYSGNTGNSSGPHLHFETWRNGKTVSPGSFGIPGMKDGGFTMSDGYAMLHKNEAVLTAPLTEQLKSGIQNIDQGVNNDYNVNVNFYGPVNSEIDVEKAVTTALNRRDSKLGRSRSIR